MNLLDSSGWLEYFVDGENADFFAPIAQDIENVIIPVICIYEIFKVVRREKSKSDALQAITVLQGGKIVEISQDIALSAAIVSRKHKLPMADSMIYAIAKKEKATLWTQDIDFKGLNNVKY